MERDSPPPGTGDKEMIALQEEFTQLLRERKQLIEDLLRKMGETGDGDGILKELTTVVHKLAGSSAMYGYAALGKISRDCQRRFLSEGQRLSSDHEALNRILGGLLESLRESIETGPDATL